MDNSLIHFDHLKNHQRLICKIKSANIIDIDETRVISTNTSHTIIYVVSGSGFFSTFNEQTSKTFECNFTINSALFVPCSSSYQIIPSAKAAQLLVIDFVLFAIPEESFENIGNSALGYMVSLTAFNCTLSLKPLINLKENYHVIDPLALMNLMVNIVSSKDYSQILLCSTLETFLIQYINYYYKDLETTLTSISAIAFTSPYDIQNGFDNLTILFSDIEFWSNNPDTNPNSILLFKAETEHKYIESPKDPLFTYSYNNNEIIHGNHICKFTLHTRSEYKIWFFPESAQNQYCIADYKDTCYIRFSIKSNHACKSVFNIYNIPTYRCLSYAFDIKQINTWQTFMIPLLNSFSESVSSKYVQNALKYIQENYQKKLSLGEIANQVHIHPSYLSTLFRDNIGQSVNNYIIFYRIIMSKNMLSSTNLSVEQIAIQNGFYDTQHFFKTFKKRVGISPSDFRKSIKS